MSFLWRFLNRERGAWFWIPGILVAAVTMLFAIHQAPAEYTLYTHARGMRVVLGPLSGEEVADFATGLRSGLERHREFSLVVPESVAARLHAVNGAEVPAGPVDWIRATRNLKAQFYVSGEVRQAGSGVQAVVELWEASREEPLHRFSGSDVAARALGSALGDSIGVALFDPQLLRSKRP